MASPVADARRARRSAVGARSGASPARADSAADADAARRRRDGRAEDARFGPRALRSRRQRQLAAGQRAEGDPADRAARLARGDAGTAERGRRTDSARSGAGPRGKLSLHAERRAAERPCHPGLRRRAHPSRRPRTERLDLRRARRGGDAHRHPLGDRGRDRRAQGAAARRRQRGRDADAARDWTAVASGEGRGGRPRQAGSQGEDPRLRPSRLQDRTIRAPRTCGRCPATSASAAGKRAGSRCPSGSKRWSRRKSSSTRTSISIRRRPTTRSESTSSVHADFRRQPDFRVDRPRAGTVREQPPDPPARGVHRPRVSAALRGGRAAVQHLAPHRHRT